MRSSRVVLHNECQATYDDLSQRFHTLLAPADIVEFELTENLIHARWRIRRLQAAESANLDLAIEENRAEASVLSHQRNRILGVCMDRNC